MSYLKISVVTVVFNGGTYLEQCIDSVLVQGYPNLEYIVIDGGSSDRSVEIIKKFSNQLNFWVSEKDAGMYHALNKGFKKSTGEVMGWINSDDLLMPKSLFLINDLFQKYSQTEWIQGLPLKISPQGYVYDHRQQSGSVYDYYLKRYNQKETAFIQQESTFWKRSLWERAGGYLEERFKMAGDFDLWMRFFEHGQLFNTRGIIGGFRKHDGQLSQNISTYLKECDQAVNHSLDRLSPEELKRINVYTWLLKFEKIPLVSRLSGYLFRDFYASYIHPKFLK